MFLNFLSLISLFAGASMGLMNSEIAWRETVSPHFRILYRTAFTPPGLTLDLEKMHNRLRLDLSMFSPWMEKERISLYLYPDRKSYLAGEFHPPDWSSGLAFYQHRALAIYDPGDHQRLIRTIAHEMTHLLFESYWGEAGRMPPQWLNEGLAMMEENKTTDEIKDSDWAKALATLPMDRLIPIRRFMDTVPVTDLTDTDKVSIWYLEAFSIVSFLYRGHSRLQFSQFCVNLRDRKTVDQAFWTVYRFRDSQAFEVAWKDWLRETFHMPEHTGPGSVAGRAGSSAGRASSVSAAPERAIGRNSAKTSFQAIGFPKFDFHDLREKNDSRQGEGN